MKQEVIAALLRAGRPDLANDVARVRAARLSPEAKEAALRKIVKEHKHAKVEGVVVDAFTASMLVKVLDKLNATNKAKMLSLPIAKMAALGWKLIGAQTVAAP